MNDSSFLGFSASYGGKELGAWGSAAVAASMIIPWAYGIAALLKALIGILSA